MRPCPSSSSSPLRRPGWSKRHSCPAGSASARPVAEWMSCLAPRPGLDRAWGRVGRRYEAQLRLCRWPRNGRPSAYHPAYQIRRFPKQRSSVKGNVVTAAMRNCPQPDTNLPTSAERVQSCFGLLNKGISTGNEKIAFHSQEKVVSGEPNHLQIPRHAGFGQLVRTVRYAIRVDH